MASRSRKTRPLTKRLQPSIPLLIFAAFGLGAGATWLAMRGSTNTPSKPAIEDFTGAPARQPSNVFQPTPAAEAAGPPDVSHLAPAEAARTLANWNYDRQNWTHAIEHYEQAIARGADNPDVRTDLGNCFRFLAQPQKALEQYEIAQKENPLHENSLFNQISLFADLLHDKERAQSVARDFIARFPQSQRADTARERILQLQTASKSNK
jgi:tetratricopeptide (TPR) repeat protein